MAGLYALPDGQAPDGVREWATLDAHTVAAFPDHELRCVAVEPLPGPARLRFGPDGWPAPQPAGDDLTLRDLVPRSNATCHAIAV